MGEFTYQALLGATVAEVVIRGLWALGGSLLTMLGFWGLRRRIRALENRPAGQTINVAPNINLPTPAREPQALPRAAPPEPLEETKFNVARHRPNEDVLHVGTTYGDMTIRLNHKRTVADILNVLSRTGVLQSLDQK